MSKHTRKFIAVLAVSLLAAILTACGGGGSGGGEVENLTVAIWGGPWGDTYKSAAIDSFEEETGINVEIVTNVQDNLAQLSTELEKDEPLYDVMFLTDPQYWTAANSGLLAPVDYDNLENADDLYNVGRLEFGVSSELGAWGIAYNADMVDEPPTSWADLLDPAIAPMVGIMTPAAAEGPAVHNLAILAVAAGGTPADAGTLGIEQAQMLAENGAHFGSFGDIATLFANEDIAYATFFHQEPIYYRLDGLPAEFVLPEEGAYIVGSPMVMPANLPPERKAVAEQFMDYVVSAGAQTEIAQNIFSGPINRTVELDDELAQVVHPYGQSELDSLIIPDWNFVLENQEAWLESWQRDVQP